MIKESKIEIPINSRNITRFKNLGYEINGKTLVIKPEDLSKGSKVKITAICKFCSSENNIIYSKYYLNKSRQGFYSCFSCKDHKKKVTCLDKYGVDSYSKTDEFINSQKEIKGIRGEEKMKATMLERYGVDHFSKIPEFRKKMSKWMSSEEFKNKSKETLLTKYGVDSYSKTDEFKKEISDNKKEIVSKIKSTFMEKYGVDWYSKTDFWKEKYEEQKSEIITKIKETCLEKYGVDNVAKVNSIMNKIMKTKYDNGVAIPLESQSDWELYKKDVRNMTNGNKNTLYENWDGFDYYDKEFIKDNSELNHTDRLYPTIDHKISVKHGFLYDIEPEIISDLSNLCITKRYINSVKNDKTENNFKL